MLVTGFVAMQVKAARIHTSVELTPTTCARAPRRIRIDEIVRIYPRAERRRGAPKWQSARALGELTGVPRGRTGIGLKLTNDRTAQAWARKHRQLRAALTHLVDERDRRRSRRRDGDAASCWRWRSPSRRGPSVLSWFGAQVRVAVAADLAGEPSTTSVVY